MTLDGHKIIARAENRDRPHCRKFAPAARNYTASKLISLVGLRINEARRLDLDDVCWELGHFGKLHVRFGKGTQGSGPRQRGVPLRRGLVEAVGGHLPTWSDRLTPHVLRHFCASQLYRHGMDLLAIQELLGHWWVATTMRYVNPRELHQAGEKSQVTWSRRESEGVRGVYELAF